MSELEICIWKYSFKEAEKGIGTTFQHYIQYKKPHKCKDCSGYEASKSCYAPKVTK